MIEVLSWILVVLPVFDWMVAGMLSLLVMRNPTIITLRERAITAIMLATVATLAALLAFVRFGQLQLTNDGALTLLALALIIVSVPAMVWLFLLVTGRFRLPS